MPIVGATVVIDGITAVSDIYGAFTVPDVAPQYDMMVLPGGRAAEFYVGLSTRQPVVHLSVLPYKLPHIATVSGSLGPSAYVGPTAAVGYTSARLAKGGATRLAPGASDYGPFQVAWGSNQPVNGGTLYALTWALDSAEELPTAYAGWGTRAITLAADTTLLSEDITLNAVTTRNVQVTVGLPTGLTLDSIGGFVGEIGLFVDDAPCANVYALPAGLGELSPTVSAIASAASASLAGFCQRKVEDGSTAVHLPLPPQPLLALPIDAADNVGPGTRFSWTAVPNAVYQVAFILPDAVLTVYTAELDAAFPETAAVGIPLSSGPATWLLKAVSPALSVDAVVSERAILDVEGISCESYSDTRAFDVSAQ